MELWCVCLPQGRITTSTASSATTESLPQWATGNTLYPHHHLDKSKLDKSKLDKSKLDKSKLDKSKMENQSWKNQRWTNQGKSREELIEWSFFPGEPAVPTGWTGSRTMCSVTHSRHSILSLQSLHGNCIEFFNVFVFRHSECKQLLGFLLPAERRIKSKHNVHLSKKYSIYPICLIMFLIIHHIYKVMRVF